MAAAAQFLYSSNTYIDGALTDIPVNIQVRDDLALITSQIEEIFATMGHVAASIEKLPTVNLLNKITHAIPPVKKLELSVTNHKTRVVFAAVLWLSGVIGFVVGAILGRIFLDTPDLNSIATTGLVFGLMTEIPVASSALWLIRPSNIKNPEAEYQKIKQFTASIRQYTKNIEAACVADNEEQLRSALSAVFSADIEIELHIKIINSMLESIHSDSVLCQEWRSMSRAIQDVIETNENEDDMMRPPLDLYQAPIHKLGIESLSNYYKTADFLEVRFLGINHLQTPTSFIDALNELCLLIEEKLKSYWLVSSPEIKEKLLAFETNSSQEQNDEEFQSIV